ncbi:MAG: hypothetical protein LQ350_006228 [Teloschistes chrysophthalmus]|nr:MAG: hypothetical protein LQ350_006228 [Niorma chrysophthalma]
MPRLEDVEQSLLSTGSNLKERTRNAWDSFSDFALRDNVLEVAVGLILAAAFTTVTTSFVSDILLPPISLLPFFARNLEEKFAVLKPGPRYHHEGYNTPKQAKEDGAVGLPEPTSPLRRAGARALRDGEGVRLGGER